MLARSLEAAGLATIFVTNMPFWAEKIGVPRTLAVEFPFGHLLGQPGNIAQQQTILTQALTVLETTTEAGTIVHSPEPWPDPAGEWQKLWQPSEPSPIIALLAPRFREMLRQQRQQKG